LGTKNISRWVHLVENKISNFSLLCDWKSKYFHEEMKEITGKPDKISVGLGYDTQRLWRSVFLSITSILLKERRLAKKVKFTAALISQVYVLSRAALLFRARVHLCARHTR
jgi:hypothetical protein